MRAPIAVSSLAIAISLSACQQNAESEATGSEPASQSPIETRVVDATWNRAAEEARQRLTLRAREGQARNVILFVADGMSIPTIAAARIYDGQTGGDTSGVENLLTFEAFPNAALVRTYSTDSQVPDSANTATALMTGIKTRNGAISLAADQGVEVCGTPEAAPLTLAEIAEARGMATGVVTTTRITHATPATTYSHSVSRQWESDVDLPDNAVAAGCRDIAAQLLSFDEGDGIDVVMGGGRANFLPEGDGGRRGDGRNLLAEWEARGGATVTDAAGFRSLDVAATEPVLGLFANSHLAFSADRDDAEEPSLAEMTGFAIDRLSAEEDGYFLLVEAGRVDHAHHATNAYRALTDMQAFEAAIEAAIDRVDLDNTLILVTADHGHTMTFSGYPARGTSILGLVRRAVSGGLDGETALTLDRTGRPYTTLSYANGPNTRGQDDEALSDEEVQAPNYRQEATVALPSQTHSGDDVALFATGARAHYFGGSMEQNTVFHLVAYAMGWTELPGDEAPN
ncbi:alkaline phosphatase [Maricaulis sp.]|uniref:alkaline phosphatase n=1 Tax=Maricaulis sp. TaxID=1486257 RepID=UPI00262E4213|nr:alkaline phosphatase [Maricaulis sp.]